MTPAIDRMSDLQETGIWWADEWWFEPMYLEELPRPEIAERIEILKRHFNITWIKGSFSGEPPNVVLPMFFGQRGLQPFYSLMSLGRTMKYLADVPGLERKLLELRGQKSHSTYFEMQLASIFSRCGYKTSFVKEGTKEKSPDIVAVSERGKFAIECKHLDPEEREQWIDELTYKLMDLTQLASIEYAVQIELDPRLTELRMAAEMEFTASIVASIRTAIAAAIQELQGRIGEVDVDGIATVRMIKSGEGQYGYISGAPRSPHAKMRRVLQNGVLRALPQIPRGTPGVVAVFCDFPPSAKLLKLVMDSGISAEPRRYEDLVALIVFPLQTIFEQFPQVVYLNSKNKHGPTAIESAMDVFNTALNPVVVIGS